MARVALIQTTPDTVLDDVGRAMEAAGYTAALDRGAATALKVNVSWHHWYPACSTTPWQLDGVIRKLNADGFDSESLFAAHNRTVTVNARVGERKNKHLPVITAHGLRNIHLYEDEAWVRYEPKGRLRTLHEVYPEGVRIPRRLIGANIIHLPTVKTHVFTTITGAMKNAFGGLLFEKRHYCHATIHETLVDLLMIQQEIHPGIFAVMDGTFVGEGAGPRCMTVHERSLVLAGADQVAVDATSARLMGLDPFEIPYLRMAHEDGLGTAEAREIEVVGGGYRRGAVAGGGPAGHVGEPWPEGHLLGPAQTPGETAAADGYRTVVLRGVAVVSRRVLVQRDRTASSSASAQGAMGRAVSALSVDCRTRPARAGGANDGDRSLVAANGVCARRRGRCAAPERTPDQSAGEMRRMTPSASMRASARAVQSSPTVASAIQAR